MPPRTPIASCDTQTVSHCASMDRRRGPVRCLGRAEKGPSSIEETDVVGANLLAEDGVFLDHFDGRAGD
jgi:hypothetical protein